MVFIYGCSILFSVLPRILAHLGSIAHFARGGVDESRGPSWWRFDAVVGVQNEKYKVLDMAAQALLGY